MSEEENKWEFDWNDGDDDNTVYIGHSTYIMNDEMAGLTHAILLLVDAVKRLK